MIRSKRAMTLIELIVVLTIFVGMLVAIGSLNLFNLRHADIQNRAVFQHMGMVYAQRFIKDKVNNSEFISLSGTITADTAIAITLKPYDTNLSDSHIALDANAHTLSYCADYNTSGAACNVALELITNNITLTFANAVDPTEHTDFKLLAFNITKQASSSLLQDLTLTSSVFAKLGSNIKGYAYNVEKGTYYSTIQDSVDNADAGDTVRYLGHVDGVFDGAFKEQVAIDKPLALYGGYGLDFDNDTLGGEPAPVQDPLNHPTTVDGQNGNTIVVATSNVGIRGAMDIVVDGFTLKNGLIGLGITADRDGDAADSVYVRNCIIRENSQEALKVIGKNITLSDILVTAHTITEAPTSSAYRGEGVVRLRLYPEGNVSMSRTRIVNNSLAADWDIVSINGGFRTSTASLTDCEISNNSLTPIRSSVIFMDGMSDFSMSNCRVTANTNIGITGSGVIQYYNPGGQVCLEDFSIVNSTISDNIFSCSQTGGGCPISGAVNNADGGVINVPIIEDSFLLENCEIERNFLPSAGRFGVINFGIWGIEDATIRNCRIANNQLNNAYVTGSGMGIINFQMHSIRNQPALNTLIENCDIINNGIHADPMGAYLHTIGFLNGARGLSIKNCDISGNDVFGRSEKLGIIRVEHGWYDTATYSDPPENISLLNNIISDNTVNLDLLGGYSPGNLPHIVDLATKDSNAQFFLTNNTIAGNTLEDASVTTNKSTTLLTVRALPVYTGSATIANLILFDNSFINWSSSDLANATVVNATLDFSYIQSDIPFSMTDGGNNIITSNLPDFESGSYILQDISNAIDVGNPDSAYNDPEDPASPGNAKYPARGAITNDMGAYGGPGLVDGIGVQGSIGASLP